MVWRARQFSAATSGCGCAPRTAATGHSPRDAPVSTPSADACSLLTATVNTNNSTHLHFSDRLFDQPQQDRRRAGRRGFESLSLRARGEPTLAVARRELPANVLQHLRSVGLACRHKRDEEAQAPRNRRDLGLSRTHWPPSAKTAGTLRPHYQGGRLLLRCRRQIQRAPRTSHSSGAESASAKIRRGDAACGQCHHTTASLAL